MEARDLAIHYGLRLLPARSCSRIGAWLGTTLGRPAHPVEEARARHLLRVIRPDLNTPDALEAALVRLWSNIGRTFVEFSVLNRLFRSGDSKVANPAALDDIYADDRPLILCFVHLGNWEVLGQQMVDHPLIHAGRPLSAVVRPPANRAHAFIAAHRRSTLPVDLVAMSPRIWHDVMRTLKVPGGIVWLAADDADGGRVFAPFFGRAPRTDGNLGKIVRLAAATGARILPLYNERLEGTRTVSHFLPLIEVPSGRLTGDTLREQIARLDAVFDPIVRRHADQWYMAVAFGHDPTDPIRRS
jgi:KDO2-lipid IV(A) lauroyltransferase